MGRHEITELIGIYDADGGLRGEAAYIIGMVAGTVHCGLCDVTHGLLGRKSNWQAMTSTLPVPFDLVHRNEGSPDVEAASCASTPCVLARTSDGLRLLIGPRPSASATATGAKVLAALRKTDLADRAGVCTGFRNSTRASTAAQLAVLQIGLLPYQ